ncbi:small GTP-binding domain containing protein [Babesia ovis]|uniref:Small GTP-binding domain containing protein n=1 Tax=Babesia ovis TaxID=5869 RepID=A0A9W5TBM0_BABOV|nr:small GTP-binding domain containing protein [Babesia ovis]
MTVTTRLAIIQANTLWRLSFEGTLSSHVSRRFTTDSRLVVEASGRRSNNVTERSSLRDLQFPRPSDPPHAVSRRSNVPYYGENATRQPVPLSATTVTWNSPNQPENSTVIRVALVGLPNAGKSSLMNMLLNTPIAAVSPKVNTTREDIKGILCADNCQMIFTDCPGILESHRRRKFCAPLVDTAWRAYREADVCLFVLDTVKRPRADLFKVIRNLAGTDPSNLDPYGPNNCVSMELHSSHYDKTCLERDDIDHDHMDLDHEQCDVMSDSKIPVALVLNKIDLVQHKKWVKARTREMKNHGTFADIFYTSAKHGIGSENIISFLKRMSKPGHWIYPGDMVTAMPKVQVVEQAVRTYLYCWFNKELPYQVGQRVIGWTKVENGSLIIEMELYVRNDNAAKIICGIQGRIVKQMQKNVSYRLSKMWSEPVFLYIHVKVKPSFLN